MTHATADPFGTHGELHEARLHAFVVGDLTQDDPVLQGLIGGCAECRGHLTDLRRVTGLLDEVLGEERRSLSALATDTRAPGANRVASTLRGLAARSGPAQALPTVPTPAMPPRQHARARPALFALRVGAAAAAVVAAGWLVRLLLPSSQPAPSDLTLGDDQDLRLLEPVGRVPTYGTFRWSAGRGLYVRYTLSIWNAAGKADEDPVLSPIARDAPEWTPTAKDLDRLPQAIRWQVDALDELGNTVVIGPEHAALAAR